MSDAAIDLAVNDALENAARALESRAGNRVYQSAWKVAARIVRNFKILKPASRKLTDGGEQISTS